MQFCAFARPCKRECTHSLLSARLQNELAFSDECEFAACVRARERERESTARLCGNFEYMFFHNLVIALQCVAVCCRIVQCVAVIAKYEEISFKYFAIVCQRHSELSPSLSLFLSLFLSCTLLLSLSLFLSPAPVSLSLSYLSGHFTKPCPQRVVP